MWTCDVLNRSTCSTMKERSLINVRSVTTRVCTRKTWSATLLFITKTSKRVLTNGGLELSDNRFQTTDYRLTDIFFFCYRKKKPDLVRLLCYFLVSFWLLKTSECVGSSWNDLFLYLLFMLLILCCLSLRCLRCPSFPAQYATGSTPCRSAWPSTWKPTAMRSRTCVIRWTAAYVIIPCPSIQSQTFKTVECVTENDSKGLNFVVVFSVWEIL